MELENKLLKEFLRISGSTRDVFQQTIDCIYETLDCKHCTLWKVNQKANSLSLLAYKGLTPDYSKESHFVHDIKGSFSEYVLNYAKPNGRLSIPDLKKSEFFPRHTWKDVVENHCKQCTAILVPVHSEEEKVYEALVFLYLQDNMQLDDNLISNIQEYLSLSFSNYYLSRKERLTSAIIDLHNKKGNKDIGSIIHPIINDILKKYIKYEAASAFVWNPFLNQLVLSATTGMEGNLKKSETFYALGEGLTGAVAFEKKAKILNFPMDEHMAAGHEKKHRETKKNNGKSLLYIPIISVVSKSILGILRFVNKINPISENVDYFSNTDLRVLNHVSYLIGLYMEFDQTEKTMSGFSMQMVHEIKNPAVGIKGMASRLVKNLNSQTFLQKYQRNYLRDIWEYSDLQIAQTHTIEYIWKGSKEHPKNNVYIVDNVNMRDVIENSKKIVIPLTRDSGLTFDNIKISGTFPNLVIDKNAFQSVFLNLLTNCIKYRKRNSSASFKVNVIGEKASNVNLPESFQENSNFGYIIKVIDHGIGIPEEEKDKIFLLGYRRKNIEKFEIRGLGMGLTVVNKVLSDFFCNIWLHSNENPTEFRIFIPYFLNNNSYTKKNNWTKPLV